jgi:hypothetical protein
MTQILQPAFDNAAGSLTHDNLIAGTAVNSVTESIVLDTGNLTRGTLLGKITVGAATSAAKSGGNTGNGAMGSITVGTGAKAGVYTLRIVTAAADAGEFQVKDPSGVVVGIGDVGVAFSGGGLSFTLADGANNFVVGDGFDITVAAGSGKFVRSDATAANGSEVPVAILAEDADATSADVTTVAYLTGEFNTAAMTFGTGHTAASVKESLALRGIFLKTNLSA